ncbi:MAG: YceI family protein [Elusimicrobia bacterium]|jgi:polyisoprenoid-binding protein YceI|nr:YceI family protein [Elusimicrobiota bacterium]
MRSKNILLSLMALALAGTLAASDTYTVDPSHTTVGFSVRHLGISNVKGVFPKVSGTLKLDSKNIGKSSVEIVIAAASVNTNDTKRDDHLRNEDFFDVARFPTVTFKSQNVTKTETGFAVTGNLTMKGVSKPVTIPFTMSEPKDHPMAPLTVVGVEGTLLVNRRDFNISYGPSALISDTVAIDLQVEFTRPRPQK